MSRSRSFDLGLGSGQLIGLSQGVVDLGPGGQFSEEPPEGDVHFQEELVQIELELRKRSLVHGFDI
jgi:hypothetical protein